jgi:hypothetical protein
MLEPIIYLHPINHSSKGTTVHLLNKHDEGPQCKRSLLAKAVEKNLGHGLSNRAVQKGLQVAAHTECKRDVDCCKTIGSVREVNMNKYYVPQPRMPAIPMALTWNALSN